MRICCPICKKVLPDVPDDYPPRPFCSARCKKIDLGNWLDERYRVSEPLGSDDLAELVSENEPVQHRARQLEAPPGRIPGPR